MSQTSVCANFGKCRVVLKAEDPRVKIGMYTYCVGCAEERKK